MPSQPRPLQSTGSAKMCPDSVNGLTSSSFHGQLRKWMPLEGGWRGRGKKKYLLIFPVESFQPDQDTVLHFMRLPSPLYFPKPHLKPAIFKRKWHR